MVRVPAARHGCRLLCRACSEPVQSGKRIVSKDKAGTYLTYVERLKDSVQLQPPARNLSFSIARGKLFDKFVLAGQLVNLSSYSLDTPVTKSTISRRS